MKTKIHEPKSSNGWTLFDENTSIFTRCAKCNARVSTFFYKHVRERENGPLTTTIVCGPCFWKADNHEGGAPIGNQNKAGK